MKQLLFVLAVFLSFPAIAQKQAWNWYFGQGHSLDFSKGDPLYRAGGATRPFDAFSSISDSAGKLLFYADHDRLYGADHRMLQNGDSVSGGYSQQQGMLIVPKPGSSNLFYVFVADCWSCYGSGTVAPRGYRYSVVDMCRNAGRGAVVPGQKYIKMSDSAAANRMTACRDASGNGYWIIGHNPNGSQFMAWHLTAAGLSAPVVSTAGTALDARVLRNQYGGLHANPIATELVMPVSSDTEVILERYNFNNATGQISGACTINIGRIDDKGVAMNLVYSPQGRMLYLATVFSLRQYDMSSGNCATIFGTESVIWERDRFKGDFRGLQLGPDGKIYLSRIDVRGTVNIIGRISKPEIRGTGCELDSNYLTLPRTQPANKDYVFALPNFVAGLRYGNAVPCVNPAGLPPVSSAPLSISPNPFSDRLVLRLDRGQPAVGRNWILTDASGRVMQDIALEPGETSIRLPGLARGLYFYRVLETGAVVQTGKLVRE